MKTMIPMAGALALALAAPVAAEAQENGRGEGKGREARAERAGPGQDRGESRGRPEARTEVRGAVRAAAAQARPERQTERRIEQVERRVERDLRSVERPGERRIERDVRAAVLGRTADRGLIAGCPPGLAAKDNGCLPPGQARKIARTSARYDYLWNRGGSGDRYRYEDGYLYRSDNQGRLLGYLPALGGALSPGSVWPTQYQYQAAPSYLTNYYGLDDRYNYRAADGVLYGVDPQTQAIGQIAALLTGQEWNVGQAMPAGYDVYNVPYDYRDRYSDTPERMYRYDDGQVYQVDPTTRVVQAIIQLLT